MHELERSYIQRIEAILTPLTGAGNLRAQVAADVDFSQTEQTAESYKPNQGGAAPAIRSQQTSEAGALAAGAGGVPGALSNQPPAPATAPLTTPPAAAAAPGAGALSNSGSTALPNNGRRDATVNYELDKTIRHVKQPVGAIKRLSVAVVVNHRKTVASDGKVSMKPLAAAELTQINDLVREAMGYNKERGDTLNVANSPFSLPDKEVVPEVPLWKDPQTLSMGKETVKYLLFGALAAWLFFSVLRPAFRTLMQPRAASALPAAANAYASTENGMAYEQKLQNARELVQQDPKMVANVIKDWAGNQS